MVMLINSMGKGESLMDIRRMNIFSVMIKNGQKRFTRTIADFAIVDRSEHGSAFYRKITVLDYSIKRFRRAGYFFLL